MAGWACLAIGGILLLLVYLISAIAHPLLVVSQYVLGLAVCLLAYFGLIALVANHFIRVEARDDWKKDPENAMPSPLKFDWSKEREAIHYLVYQHEEVKGKIQAAYNYGKRNGLRATDTSAGSRYDARSSEGAKLNDFLDKLWSLEHSIDAKIKSNHAEIKKLISNHDWASKHIALVGLESAAVTGRIGVLAYLITFFGLLFWNPQWVQYLSSNSWFAIPSLRIVYAPSAIAAVIGWVASFWSDSRIWNHMLHSMHKEEIEGWAQVSEDIENARDLPDDYRSPSRASDAGNAQQQQPKAGATQSERMWFEVLGVAENASADQINTAYRQRIREYHPDYVASRGGKLQEVAEQETKAINLAKEQAKLLGKV